LKITTPAQVDSEGNLFDDQWKQAFQHRMAITLTSTVLLLGITVHAEGRVKPKSLGIDPTEVIGRIGVNYSFVERDIGTLRCIARPRVGTTRGYLSFARASAIADRRSSSSTTNTLPLILAITTTPLAGNAKPERQSRVAVSLRPELSFV
jgi:hypothetical protein